MADGTHALLLAIARDVVAGDTRATRAQLGPDADLGALLDLAIAHRMVGVAGTVLDAIGALTDRTVAATWRDVRTRDAASALVAAQRLAELARLLDAQGIPFLAYKGPALAQRAYGDVGVRPCADVDIVIAPADRARARAALVGAGFVSRHAMNAAQERVISAGQGHAEFARTGEDGVPFVELHWRFASRRLAWTLAPGPVLARAARITVGGVSVRIASDDDHALLLAMHGARHAWAQLEWIVSFARVARADDLHEAARERAASIGARRALLFSGLVAAELVGFDLPREARDAAERDALAVRLAREVIDGWRRGAPITAIDERLLLERSGDRMRWTTARLFYPTPREWEAARLPGWATPLYVPLRLARLAFRSTGGDGE